MLNCEHQEPILKTIHILLLMSVLCLAGVWAHAETVVQAWTQRYNNPSTASGQAWKVVTDANGNVIVAGYTTEQNAGYDILVIKYSAAGLALWTNRYSGYGYSQDTPYSLAVDGTGNVLVAGRCENSLSQLGYLTIKYSASGLPLWTNYYNGSASFDDYLYAMAVDGSGNVVVTGSACDASGISGYATIKYSSTGVPVWTNRYSESVLWSASANAIAVDGNGNVIVTGNAPRSSSSTNDYVTIKYSAAGVALLTNRYNGPGDGDDYAEAVAVYANGDFVVTGYSYNASGSGDYATIKYSSAGVPLWTNRYNGPANYQDFASAVAIAGNGNIFVTGNSSSGSSFYDYATIAYSGAGIALWTNRYSGPGYSNSRPTGMVLDGSGNILVTGYSYTNYNDANYITIKYSGAGVPLWINRYDGPGTNDARGYAVAVDSGENVYVTGYSIDTNGFSDCATIKYSGAGLALWTNFYNGPSDGPDVADAVAVDSAGNCFVTGYSGNSDNGRAGAVDYLTIAYSGAGTALWTNRYNGPGTNIDQANAVAVDGAGNVFVTGYSYGASTTNSADYATIKYSGSGVPLWTNRYDGPGTNVDQASALVVNGSGDVAVTGYSYNASGSADYATIKYSAAGIPLWTNRYNGPGNSTDQSVAAAADSSGNVLVTGYSYGTSTASSADYATIKYSSAGIPLWTNRYNGPGNNIDQAAAVAVDGNGNVLVTGYSYSTSTASSADYATIKYSAGGAPLWTNRYNGPGNNIDQPAAVAVDGDGNVLVTGYSYSSSTASSADYATIKYSAAGVPLWTNRYNGLGKNADQAAAVAVDTDGNVFVTGSSTASSTTNRDYATIKYSGTGLALWTNYYNGPADGDDSHQTKLCLAIGPDGAALVTGGSDGTKSIATVYDYLTVKYISPPEIMTQPVNRTNSVGSTVTFAISATGSASLKYQWQLNGTNLTNGGSVSGASSNVLTLANVQTNDAGNYTVVITNAFGSVTSSVAVLTVIMPSSITLTSSVLTNGVFKSFFTNVSGVNFTVLTASNLSLPLSNWTEMGSVTEIFSGQFQFTDPQASNSPKRFYRVRSP
jgi:uncharacterized delta-60 repeat protein